MAEFALLNFAQGGASAGQRIRRSRHQGRRARPADRCRARGDWQERRDTLGFHQGTSCRNGTRPSPCSARSPMRLPATTNACAQRRKPLASVRLLAPILYPDAVFCAFANYTDHMKEMSGREPPDKTKVKPLFFIKLARARHHRAGRDDPAAGLFAAGRLGGGARRGDRPAGAQCQRRHAMDHVAGYTILNDLSLRDQGNRSDWNVKTDFLSGKSFDTGAPMGPGSCRRGRCPTSTMSRSSNGSTAN